MTEPTVTIVVSPRERYGLTQASLESLFAETPEPFALVVVTCAAPAALCGWLDAEAERRGFRHVRHPLQLAPNHARNLGAAHARTDYIVFADNDVLYAPGWLGALLRCAQETGADVVAPLTCQGDPLHQIVHHAGGEFAPDAQAFFAAPAGARSVVEVAAHQFKTVSELELTRAPTQLCEFHCTLVRRDTLEALGGFDPGMTATKEHLDFCMSVLQRGGSVVFEPASVVTYLFPNRDYPIEPADWPFFLVRWSPRRQAASLRRFAEKWGLQPEGYLEERAQKLQWRHFEGVAKPLLRRLSLWQRTDLPRKAAARLVWLAIRGAAHLMTLRADFGVRRLRSAVAAE
jgi:glycosyltransferase involved in cell wall biosynthesis